MKPLHAIPALDGLPAMCAFRCFVCNYVITEPIEDELVDSITPS